ncbi:small ribosomal subunit protein mS37 isoform X2 [Saimiri boliviensis]|uniref:small ribosomal subunit protein mS37 isoform X2 n=1 Tax=Saimiri boliviensis TaxID=27679 RepID=UPI000533CB16|nr:coiled-coil-helix-coiled-coil-helix domain-containing protein 1 isoform X2 [Saimiri boliviensis boliviensis]
MATPSLRGRLARPWNSRKPVLKPNKPLILANRVGERRREKGEATCITEMSVMMACWKQNEFRDDACRKEIQGFLDCAARAQERPFHSFGRYITHAKVGKVTVLKTV